MSVEYRTVPQFPAYRVGNDGSVWSSHQGEWRRLSPGRGPTGHQYVNLHTGVGGRPSRHFVHRLVLELFIGPCPEGMECCHRDGNPANNTPGNLRWGTRQSNVDDRDIHGTDNKGERHGMSKTTAEIVLAIRARYAACKGNRRKAPAGVYDQLAAEFGMTYGNIENIVQRKSWRHLPATSP